MERRRGEQLAPIERKVEDAARPSARRIRSTPAAVEGRALAADHRRRGSAGGASGAAAPPPGAAPRLELTGRRLSASLHSGCLPRTASSPGRVPGRVEGGWGGAKRSAGVEPAIADARGADAHSEGAQGVAPGPTANRDSRISRRSSESKSSNESISEEDERGEEVGEQEEEVEEEEEEEEAEEEEEEEEPAEAAADAEGGEAISRAEAQLQRVRDEAQRLLALQQSNALHQGADGTPSLERPAGEPR